MVASLKQDPTFLQAADTVKALLEKEPMWYSEVEYFNAVQEAQLARGAAVQALTKGLHTPREKAKAVLFTAPIIPALLGVQIRSVSAVPEAWSERAYHDIRGGRNCSHDGNIAWIVVAMAHRPRT